MARSRAAVRARNAQFASIEGAEKLQAKIDALPGALTSAVREALWQGVSQVVDRMKGIAPVDPIGANPEHLRDHIHAEAGPHSLSFDVIADPKDEQGRGYAAHLEYGHHNGTTHVPPEPFFWPVVRVEKKRVKNRVSRATTKAIKGIAAK